MSGLMFLSILVFILIIIIYLSQELLLILPSWVEMLLVVIAKMMQLTMESQLILRRIKNYLNSRYWEKVPRSKLYRNIN